LSQLSSSTPKYFGRTCLTYLAGIAVVAFLTALAVPETRFFLHGAESQAADSANLTRQDQSTQDMPVLPD
jgi:hypothetical protein